MNRRILHALLARGPLSAAALCLLAPPLLAQTTGEPAAPAPNEPVVALSPFVVSGKEAEGYATTSSMGASRIAVPITELPSSVIVINEKLIADLAAVNAGDTLNLVGGVTTHAETGSAQQNRFSMRGYTNTSAQRDGFTDLLFGLNGGFSYTFIERMEVLKGPNGILYGQNNPGGMLNLVSKKPLDRARTRVSAAYGSDNFVQGDLDISNFLGADKKLGYRLSASYRNTDGPLNHPGDGTKGFLALNPTVRYRMDNGLEVWAWVGLVRDESPRLNPIVRGFRSSTSNGAFLTEIAYDGGAHNVLTNLSKVDTDSYEVGATKTLQFGEVRLDMRVLGRYNKQSDNGLLVRTNSGGPAGSTDVFVDASGNILGFDARNIDIEVARTQMAGFYRVQVLTSKTSTFTDTETYAADAAFTFRLGPTDHKLLFFGTVYPLKQDSIPGINGINYTVSSAAGLAALGIPDGRVWLYPLSRNTLVGLASETVIANANVVAPQSTVKLDSDQYGYGVMERMSFWNNRAFVVGGARFTSLESTTQTGTAAPVPTSDESWTSSFGSVVKAYKGKLGEAALFVNLNETFVPVFTLDTRLATLGRKFDNRNISINEVGVKVDLLNSRAVATFAVYDMTEDNVLVSFTDLDGSVTGVSGRAYNVPSGKQTTKGWDTDISYNAARGLDFIFSYGMRDARLASGIKPSGQPTATASALGRYEVQSGALKNASLLWQYSWWSDSILNNRTYWTVPPGYVHTAVLGYKWKNMNIRLRVENVFDTLKLRPGTNETAVGITNKRNYRLSVDYLF
jgi:outer membrane receptor protein involved in Fe transport